MKRVVAARAVFGREKSNGAGEQPTCAASWCAPTYAAFLLSSGARGEKKRVLPYLLIPAATYGDTLPVP